MSKPKLLDLFCCEGGAGKGYQDAGFDVTGVDIEPRFAKRYPGAFINADALTYLRGLSQSIPPAYTEWIGRHLMDAITQAGGA